MFRFLTAGESHGPALTVIVEGMPAGVQIQVSSIEKELARRRLGYGRGPRMQIEQDRLEVLSGVRSGVSLGSPISLVVHNSEWGTWQRVMPLEGKSTGAVLTEPRPGHADFSGMMKYGFDDARNVLERASARETAARTAAGSLAKQFLKSLSVEVLSHVVAIGPVQADVSSAPLPSDAAQIDQSPVRCADTDAEKKMMAEIDRVSEDGDSLGGVFEVLVYGVPPGLGSYVSWDKRLDGRLAQAMMSIPAIKGVEIGPAYSIASRDGSNAHDEIFMEDGSFIRKTNFAGGIEGGMSNGQPISVRGAMKPLSTLRKPLRTVDVTTGEESFAFKERTDVCAVPAAAVVGEAVVAIVLAQAFVEKFGGDSLNDIKGALSNYLTRVADGAK